MLTSTRYVFWAPLIVLGVACGGGNQNSSGNQWLGGVTSTQPSGGATGVGGTSHTGTNTGGKTGVGNGGTATVGGSNATTAGATSTANTSGGSSAVGGASHTGGTKSTTATGGTKATTGGTKATTGGTKATTGGANGSGGGTKATTGGANGSGGTSHSGGSSGALSNVVDVVVDEGPSSLGYMNGLFVSVTLCVPGTSTCQTIDHVLVDTGSYGLRVLESALTISLPLVTNSSGAVLAECTQYVSGTAWGPIVHADVKLGGETAPSIAVQTIGEGKYPMPNAAACTGVPLNDLSSLRSNGVLGVGFYQQDCGAACASTSANPGIYMSCTSTQAGGCKPVAVPLELQVSNPIAAFATDNNGLIIQLPDVPEQGAATVAGKVVFGIGTQSNNGLGSATVLTPTSDYGYIGTTFPVGGKQYQGLLDSGSNGVFFLNAATSGLAACSGASDGFYCPSSTTSLNATLTGGGGASIPVTFKVANISRLSSSMCAFNNVAGEMPGFPDTDPEQLDYIWGLSFFYGKKVFTAIEQMETPGGSGPYVAF
jgi:hypothetical protein